jgi:hypothetical protein
VVCWMRGVREDLSSFPGNSGVIVRVYGRQTTANDFRGPAYPLKLLFVLAGGTTQTRMEKVSTLSMAAR